MFGGSSITITKGDSTNFYNLIIAILIVLFILYIIGSFFKNNKKE